MKHSNARRSALFAATLLALGLAATAVHAESTTVTASHSAGGIELRSSRAAPAFHLRVSGPDGQVFEETYLSGEPMLVQAGKLGYGKWLDGSYRFEVTPVLGDRVRSEAESLSGRTVTSAALSSHGSFQVLGGKPTLMRASKEDSPEVSQVGIQTDVSPQDVVHADDLIVQGSICAGFDCVNNEAFGFDTLRLKENNTRIGFMDTSVGSFPSNDWQLTANDSASGGANKFSIEDITGAKVPFTLTAGAPSNSLFVSSTGRLGLGTSTPVLHLHITATDTPAQRLEQTSGGGFTAQTWDIAGNEANFFVRDVTGGSRLPFRIRPGAPTSSIDIDAVGDVGIGTAAPDTSLHVSRGSGAVTLRLARTGGVINSWDMTNNTSTGRLTLTDDVAGTRVPIKFGTSAVDNLFRVGIVNTSTVDVNGDLVVNGDIQVSGTVGPDYVFAPNFRLPSIAEHAEYMWDNKHLPKVGPAKVNADGQGVIDLGALSHGMLEELEYAHVYIAELNGTVEQLQQQLDSKDDALQQLRAEVDAIKQALKAD